MPDHAADPFIQEVGLFLATCRTASLATVAEDGSPHAANVQYAEDEHLRLYWVSSSDSAHSRYIARDGRVALTIYARDDRVQNIHGVQIHGIAEAIEDKSDWNLAWELFTGKFPFAEALPQYRQMIESQNFYRLTPTWMRWIDNRKGFGYKVERKF